MSDSKQKTAVTLEQAIEYLEITSQATVDNWLLGGSFPGAYQNENSEWRFPLKELKEVKERIEDLQEKNMLGNLQPPDNNSSEKPPLF